MIAKNQKANDARYYEAHKQQHKLYYVIRAKLVDLYGVNAVNAYLADVFHPFKSKITPTMDKNKFVADVMDAFKSHLSTQKPLDQYNLHKRTKRAKEKQKTINAKETAIGLDRLIEYHKNKPRLPSGVDAATATHIPTKTIREIEEQANKEGQRLREEISKWFS